MTRTATLTLVAILISACGGAELRGAGDRGGEADLGQVANGPRPAAGPIAFRAYAPAPEEKYANGKRLAARIAQGVTTYGRGASAAEVAREVAGADADVRDLAEAIGSLIEPGMRSGGDVVYPQLSGVTPTTLGAMVVVRQVLEDEAGRRKSTTRVLDIRLRRNGGPWQLDRVGSVGGSRRTRPKQLAAEAARVVDHPRITLTDSARWDIYSGRVDPALLRRLAELADQHPISVGVLTAGHPRNVWNTDRRSAHTDGYAADIYAVGRRLVVRQQAVGTPAYELARAAVSGGARQVGSPWTFGPGSFSDDVHADHLHIQQAGVAQP